jgi:hypothetical protein
MLKSKKPFLNSIVLTSFFFSLGAKSISEQRDLDNQAFTGYGKQLTKSIFDLFNFTFLK